MSDYFKWKTTQDAVLGLELASANGTGLTGSDPRVSIRRKRDVYGSILDNFYWDGSGSFTGAVIFHDMIEVDATGSPGFYTYHFSQSMVAEEYIYNVYYTSSLGYDVESHVFEIDKKFSKGRVWMDLYSGLSGTAYPFGTETKPVGRWCDALAVANANNLYSFQFARYGFLTLNEATISKNFYGDGQGAFIDFGDQMVQYCGFQGIVFIGSIGASSWASTFTECHFYNVENIFASLRRCQMQGTCSFRYDTIAPVAQLDDCSSYNIADTTYGAAVAFNLACTSGKKRELNVRRYSGHINIINSNQPGSIAYFHMLGGRIIIDSSCTDGEIYIEGDCELINSGSCTVVDNRGISLRNLLTQEHGSGSWAPGAYQMFSGNLNVYESEPDPVR